MPAIESLRLVAKIDVPDGGYGFAGVLRRHDHRRDVFWCLSGVMG